MPVSAKTKQELREILTFVVGKGYNLSIYPDNREPIEHSQDIGTLVEATVQDSFQVFHVYQSRKLEGTFVCDIEMADKGERLVSSFTRSLNHIFK